MSVAGAGYGPQGSMVREGYDPLLNRMTDSCENITLSQHRLWAVKIEMQYFLLTAMYWPRSCSYIVLKCSLIWTISISERDTETRTSVSSSVPSPFIHSCKRFANCCALLRTHRTEDIKLYENSQRMTGHWI